MLGADRQHLHSGGDRRHLSRDRDRIGGQIRLGDQHQRLGPDSHANASSRSTRPRSGSGSIGSTTAAMSRLAANTCPLACFPAVRRTTAVRRGSTASAVIRPSGQSRTTNQSPAHGKASGSWAAAASSAPATLARTGPVTVATVYTPRSARSTRPGRQSATPAVILVKAAWKVASQPRDASAIVIENLS